MSVYTKTKKYLIGVALSVFLLSGGVFAATITSNGTGGGNWNAGTTWSGGSVPASGDTVVIASGDSVVINGNFTVDTLSIAGELVYEDTTTSRSLTITHGVKIQSGAKFNSGTGGGVYHDLKIGGNFDNDGDFVANIGAANIRIYFEGTSTMLIKGSSISRFGIFIYSGSGKLITSASQVVVVNTFDLQSSAGDFVVGSGGLVLEAGVVNIHNSSFDAIVNNSLVIFQGSASKTVDVDGSNISTLSFYNCVVAGHDVTLQATNANVAFNFQNRLTLTDKKFTFSGAGYTESITYGSNATLEYNGSFAQTTDVEWTTTLSPANVVINNSNGVSIPSGESRLITGSLSLTSGELKHDDVLTVNGNIIGGSGIYGQTDDGTLVMNGSSSANVTVNNSFSLHNLIIKKTNGSTVTVNVASGASINTDSAATVRIQSGTLSFSESSQFALGDSNRLKIDADGILETAGTDISGFSFYEFSEGSTVRFTGSATETIPSADYGNLTINKSGGEANIASGGIKLSHNSSYNSTLKVQSGALNLMGQSITLEGTGGTAVLEVDDGAVLRTSDAAGDSIGTDITGFDSYSLSGEIHFKGKSGDETLPAGVSGESFTLLLNKAAGKLLTAAATTIGGSGKTVYLTKGVIDVSSGALTLAAGTVISGGSSSSYVDGAVSRVFDSSVESGSTQRILPIGSSSGYFPVRLNFNTLSGAVTISAAQHDSAPSGTLPSGIAAYASGLNRYWTINSSGSGTFSNYTVDLVRTGTTDTQGFLRIIKGTNADEYTDIGSNTGYPDATRISAVFASFSDFAVARAVATKIWDGGGSDSNWSTAANWNDDTAPQKGDIILLDHSQLTDAYSVELDASASIDSLDKINIDPDGGSPITLTLTKNITLILTSPTDPLSVANDDSATLVFNGTAIDMNGGYDSSLTAFGDASTVKYTGGSTLYPDTYGNLTVDNSSTISASGAVTVSGDFIKSGTADCDISGALTVSGGITKSGSGDLDVKDGALTASSLTINAGSLTKSGSGDFTISGTVTNSGTIHIEGTGNTDFTGGTFTNNSSGHFNIGSGGAGTTKFADVNNSGDLDLVGAGADLVTFSGAYSGTGTISGNGSAPNITFESTFTPSGDVTFGTQTLIFGNGAADNITINGGTFTPSTNTSFRGTSITVNGGSMSTTVGLFKFEGSAAQSVGSGSGTPRFYDLTVNNSNGVTLNDSIVVYNTLTLTSGIVSTTSTNILKVNEGTVSGGSSTAYINGPMAHIGTTGTKVFPLGKSGEYRPVDVLNISGTNPEIWVEMIPSDPGGTAGSGLTNISTVRYWQGGLSSGSLNNFDIRLYWGSNDGVDGSLSNLRVAVATSSNGTYNDIGNNGTSGDSNSGSIRSNNYTPTTSPLYFTLADAANDNSLPVELLSFKAEAEYNKVNITWSTASELNNLGFNIYRAEADDPESWELVNNTIIEGQGSVSAETNYNYTDTKVVSGKSYKYKLESVSMNGINVEEKVIDVEIPVPSQYALMQNYPNPFNPTTNIKFLLPESQQVTLEIYNINGQLVKTITRNQMYQAGEYVVHWNATDNSGNKVSSGMYMYVFRAGAFHKIGKMILLK